VGNDNAALSHHRHEISITQPVGDVPAHAQFNDLGVEPAPSVNRVTRDRPSALPNTGCCLRRSRRSTVWRNAVWR
jgi:hypothetical protein